MAQRNVGLSWDASKEYWYPLWQIKWNYLSKNPVHHERTKRGDVKLHFIRNEVSKAVINMEKVHTDGNPADMLTKVNHI